MTSAVLTSHRPARRAVTVGSIVASLVGSLVIAAAGPAAAAPCPSAGGAVLKPAAAPSGAEVVVNGFGWGHGMGMSQYGAQGAARLGCNHAQILGTYYRDTHLVKLAMTAPVRLTLLTGGSRSTVAASEGTVTWSANGVAAVPQAKGQTWTVVRRSKDGRTAAGGVALVDAAGKQRAWVGDTVQLTASHSGSLVRIRSFKGTSTSASADLRVRYDRTVFTGSVDGLSSRQWIVASGGRTAAQKYLGGLAEVPLLWPQEALRAQVVAARTYLHSKYSDALKAYSLQITTADQVYAGAKREDEDARLGGHWRAAVNATGGEVIVTRAGEPITAMYSSSMGGYSEDRIFTYGNPAFSYLKAVDDSRWDLASDNPYRAWTAGYSRAGFAAKLGFASISQIQVGARGSASRLSGFRVTGVRNGREVTLNYTGMKMRSILGLRSPGLTIQFAAATKPLPKPTPTVKPTPTPKPTAPAKSATNKLRKLAIWDQRSDLTKDGRPATRSGG
jgi:SpoIID/LytB domain protein